MVINVLLISGRFLFWIASLLYFYTRKNTLFFVGSLLFIITFGFVSFNALFSQIKFTSVPNIKQNSILSSPKVKIQENTDVTSVPLPSHLHKNLSSSSLSESTLKMQKKLTKLGLYDGPLDGLEGPKTRRAIALWKQQTTERMQNRVLPSPITDEIAVLIKRSEMEMANETTKTRDLLRSKETVLEPSVSDIRQVQNALRIFGHQEVIITGVEDQKTGEALKQFQKMFDLPITGKINHTVLMKMREVGLLK
ncbi:peptidoglycan-binding domain-containing protein [Bartonella gliris]|uniref:peptidoglycan-binding domain-containing protein n=1 Tax=Bartonella gliris TaxID=3004109 RepID=UPI00295EC64B|nr:peptidoglycan-binding domain-containing protein [Bartonella gliris]